MNADPPAPDDPRGSRIRRAWHGAWGNPQRRKPLDTLTFQDVSQLAGMVLLLILLIFHFELLAPEDILPGGIPGAAVGILALFLPVQSWATVAYLRARRQEAGPASRWKWMLLFLGGCVPLFGLYVWPLWRRFAGPASPPRPSGDPAPAWRPRVARVPFHLSLLPVLGLAVGVFLLPIAWAFWMTQGEALPPDRKARLLLLCLGFHLAAAVCLPNGLRDARRRVDPKSAGGALLRWLPAIVLLGLPGIFAAMGICVPSLRVVTSRLLVPAAFENRSDWRRKPLWQGLEGAYLRQEARSAGRRPWVRLLRPAAEPKLGQAEDRRILLFHLKSLLALPSTVVLSWWAFDGELSAGLWAAVYLTSALASVGLLLELALIGANFLGENALSRALARRPYGFFLLAPNSLALIGLLAGAALAGGEGPAVGAQLFAVATGLPTILALVVAMRRGFERDRAAGRDFLIWIGSSLVFVGVALFLRFGADSALARLLALALVIAAELSLGASLGGWLLRPFHWRQILDPVLPLRLRLTLLLIAISAALPASGLAVPLWILVRQRWWRRWEDLRWRPFL